MGGPAALQLSPHALASVAELPVLEIMSATHILADLTLGLGKVVHDYLQQSSPQALRTSKELLASEHNGRPLMHRAPARAHGLRLEIEAYSSKFIGAENI